MRPPSTAQLCLCLLPLALLMFSACERTVTIRGDLIDEKKWPVAGVVDISGEPLPGVAVTVHGQEAQTVTDALGQYRVRAFPGQVRLNFMKSGYTSGQLHFDASDPRTIEATQAVLWPLPSGWGVYIFENGRYHEMTRIEPRRYLKEDGSPLYATKMTSRCRTNNQTPLLICHRMPGYDLRLYRLEQTEMKLKHDEGAAYDDKVWAVADSRVVFPEPIDEPERLLVEVRLQEPLPYGTYALHWGAFDGYTTTSTFAFLFDVVDPALPVEVTPEGESEEVEVEEEPVEEEDNPSGDADF